MSNHLKRIKLKNTGWENCLLQKYGEMV